MHTLLFSSSLFLTLLLTVLLLRCTALLVAASSLLAPVTHQLPGLDTSHVGFMGFSAGSHLTGHLNVKWANRTYSRVDGADDEPCRPDFSMMVYPWESVTQSPVNASPSQASALNVTKDTPPTMLVQVRALPSLTALVQQQQRFANSFQESIGWNDCLPCM